MNWRSWTWPLGLLLLVWAAYLGSLDNGFHYDDSHSILENYHLRSLADIPSFFVDPGTFSREPAMAMYRPVLLCTYALNYALGRYRPLGYHLVELLLHGLVVLLVYRLLAGLSGSRALAWWGGALFGLHPVHTQAVNYISSRSELLCTAGVLAAFYLVAVLRRPSRWAWVAYLLALLSKEAAVVLLPLMLLHEWHRPREARNWKAHLPFYLLTLAYLAAISANRFLPRSLAQDVRPFGAQVCTQLKALVYYLKLLAMPTGLSVEPGFRVSQTLSEPAVVASAVLLLSLGYWAWRGARRSWAGYGLLWFYAGLSLTFLVPLNVLVNEHRLYLPSVGVGLALLGTLARQPRTRHLAPVAWAALLLFGLLTWQRNRVWQDELALWEDAVAKAPSMFRAQGNLGQALLERGDWARARQALERAAALAPGYAKTWNNLGLACEELGEEARAEQAFRQALTLQPDLAGALNNLGRLRLRQGRTAQAEAYLQQALEQDPGYTQARVNLGLLYQQRGQRDAALFQYQEAFRQDPESAEALNNLGLLRAEEGRLDLARQALEQALALRPGYQEALINLEVVELQQAGVSPPEAYARLVQQHPERAELWKALGDWQVRAGQWVEATRSYEEALKRGTRGLYSSLAGALRGAGRLEEAIAAYQRALQEEPGDPALYNNLASALAAVGRLDEAVAATRRALELDPENARATQNLEKLLRAQGPAH